MSHREKARCSRAGVRNMVVHVFVSLCHGPAHPSGGKASDAPFISGKCAVPAVGRIQVRLTVSIDDMGRAV